MHWLLHFVNMGVQQGQPHLGLGRGRSLSESFYKKLQRNNGESFEDWEVRYEQMENKVLAAVRKLSGQNATQLLYSLPPVIRAWWSLRHSGLVLEERAQINLQAGGSFDWKQTLAMLKTRFPSEVLKEHDHARGRSTSPGRRVLYGSEAAEEAEWEELMQILALDDCAPSSDPVEWEPQYSLEECVLVSPRQGSRLSGSSRPDEAHQGCP